MGRFVEKTGVLRRGFPAFVLATALGLSGCGDGEAAPSDGTGNARTEDGAGATGSQKRRQRPNQGQRRGRNNQTPAGTVIDSNGDPWESFDYDSSIGDNTATSTYDNGATLQLGGQGADLWHVDPAQAPEFVSSTEYKVRKELQEMQEMEREG